MEVYGFLNTFFVASILISSILVVVLVYHFRQRLGAMEEKTETLLQIVNNVVQKLNNDNEDEIQNFVPLSNVNSNDYYNETDIREDEIYEEQDNEEENSNEDEDDEDNDEDDEDNDEDDEEDDEDKDEEDDEDKDEEDDEDKDEEDDEDKDEDDDEDKDEDDDDEEEQEVKKQVTEEIESLKIEDITKEYEKMNVTQLKQMVKDRNLSNAVSKMKKPELVSLLVKE